jgi:hypothetical protein
MRIHVITNSETGEISEVPYTAEEEASADAQLLAEKSAQSCSPRQARLALLQFNLLDTVEGAIKSGSRADQISWEFATEIVRGSSLVQNMSAALGLTDAQLDQLFALAVTL